MTTQSNVPFKSDGEYLDQEFAWIRSHVELLDMTKRLGDVSHNNHEHRGGHIGEVSMVAEKELSRRVIELQNTEQKLREGLDARLEIHREHGSFSLGLDAICEEYDLSLEERMVLLALSLPAVSANMASEVFSSFGMYGDSLQVQELMALLQAESTQDYLNLRLLFYVDAKLLQNNLIVLDLPSLVNTPGGIHTADVRITLSAFSVIAGISEMGRGANIANDNNEGSEGRG